MTTRVDVLSPDGVHGTVDAADVQSVVQAGGRVLTSEEAAQRKLEKEYESKSTLDKVLGVASQASPITSVYQTITGDRIGALPPEAEAYRRGAEIGATAGLSELSQRAISGKGAIERGDQLATAYPGLTTAGQVAGTIAGVVATSGAGRAIAGAAKAASPALAKASSDIAQVSARIASRGVAQKAALAGARMGLQGALEGGAYAGTNYVSSELARDRALTTDKLISTMGQGALLGGLTGAALGAGGSLLGSKLSSRASAAISDAEATAAVASGASPNGIKTWLSNTSDRLALKALGGNKRTLANAMNSLGTNGRREIADYVHALQSKSAGETGILGGTAKVGLSASRADELLAAIEADMPRIGERISKAVKSTPAQVDTRELLKKAENIYESMLRDPTKVAGAEAFQKQVALEFGAIERGGSITADGAIDAAESYYQRAALEKRAWELGQRHGSAAKDAYKQFMREWDRANLQALDDAAKRAGNPDLAKEILDAKREWQVASEAKKLATDGASKFASNNEIPLRVGAGGVAAIATGHVLEGLGALGIGKVVSERAIGSAAYSMRRMADESVLSSLVRQADRTIASAAKGIASPAKKLAEPAVQKTASSALARTAIDIVASYKSNPNALIEAAGRQAGALASFDNQLANDIAARQVAAVSLLESKVPLMPEPDPLQLHQAPKLTRFQQEELAQTMRYVQSPDLFFKEAAKGRLTFEGAEVARVLMPRAYEELQSQVYERIISMVSSGKEIPYRQRLLIGTLLDIPATIGQRPEHAQFLQGLLQQQEQEASRRPRPRTTGVSKPQLSALDRIEEG